MSIIYSSHFYFLNKRSDVAKTVTKATKNGPIWTILNQILPKAVVNQWLLGIRTRPPLIAREIDNGAFPRHYYLPLAISFKSSVCSRVPSAAS